MRCTVRGEERGRSQLQPILHFANTLHLPSLILGNLSFPEVEIHALSRKHITIFRNNYLDN